MDTVIIRTATLNDIAILLEFEQGIIAAERPLTSALKDDPIHYYDLKAFISDPEVEVVIAEIDGKPAGSGYARIREAEPCFRNERYCYLGFMYVQPEYRGQGLNSKIMDALITWGTRQGLVEFQLEVFQGNDAAIKAYEKAGFSKHLIEMRMEVGG